MQAVTLWNAIEYCRGKSGERGSVYHRPMDSLSPDLTAFILAGGKSSRMGADKALVMLDGRALLARALEVARFVTPEVRIVGDPAKFAQYGPVVQDGFRDCGPLGGIHAALRASDTDLNLILAVDMPFVSAGLLQYMIGRARAGQTPTVTVPQVGGGWQPLCAMYRRDFAYVAEQALLAGRYKIDALFEVARTQVIGEEELEAAGFSTSMFRNLNTQEDLQAAQEGVGG